MIFGTDPFPTEFDLAGASTGSETYEAATLVVSCHRETYLADTRVRGVFRATYTAAVRVGIPSPYYQADTIIVYDSSDPRITESFVNTFFWAYANEYHQLDLAIEMMVHRLKLDYATGDDMEDYWGPLLEVRRRASESDEDYRSRLLTRRRVITSSGTASNIKAVINKIIGVPDGAVLESFYPGYLRLSWSSPEVAKTAYDQSALINLAMDGAVAAGVEWGTAYPYQEYSADFSIMYYDSETYDASVALAIRRGVQYWAATGLWESGDETYDADAVIYSHEFETYRAKAQMYATGTASYLSDSRLYALTGWPHTDNYDAGAYVSRTIRRSYLAVAILEASS